MTAVATRTGALSHQTAAWHTIDWYAVHRTVRRLQARIVKAVPKSWTWHDRVLHRAFERLERHAEKLARAVLRGLAGAIPPGYPAVIAMSSSYPTI